MANNVEVILSMPQADAMLLRDRIDENEQDPQWHLIGIVMVSKDGSNVPVRMQIEEMNRSQRYDPYIIHHVGL